MSRKRKMVPLTRRTEVEPGWFVSPDIFEIDGGPFPPGQVMVPGPAIGGRPPRIENIESEQAVRDAIERVRNDGKHSHKDPSQEETAEALLVTRDNLKAWLRRRRDELTWDELLHP